MGELDQQDLFSFDVPGMVFCLLPTQIILSDLIDRPDIRNELQHPVKELRRKYDSRAADPTRTWQSGPA